MSFTAKDVMTLRQKTGLGMMDCKKALTENNGDMVKAEEWLRAQRKGKMDSRTERTTGEGRLEAVIDGSKATMIEIRTETDFTARTETFVAMVQAVAQEAMQQPAGAVTATDSMTKQVDELRITTGENVNFARGIRIDGGTFGKYIHHDGKRGAVIQVDGDADPDLLKGLCQHIVFHDPLGVSQDDVPAEKLTTISEQALQEAKDSGKNDEIAAKIAEGKVRKYLEEHTLLHQKYILDEATMIKDMLPAGVTVKGFVRYTLGET